MISNSKIGKKWYNDGNKNYFLYPTDTNPNNLIEGMLPKRHKSESEKKHQSDMLTGRIAINDGKKNKMINPKDLNYYLSLGYFRGSCHKTRGMKNKHHTKEFKDFISNNTKNRIWINNGNINKRVKPNDLQQYLNTGFVKGKISKKCNDHRKCN